MDNTVPRLQRLEAWLREDPANPLLLAETCDAALAQGEHGRARTLVEQAQALGLDRRSWVFRLARVCLAAREDAQARELLVAARDAGLSPALVDHDLAFLAWRQGQCEEALRILAPWLQAPDRLSADLLVPMQVLWLRAMHHLQRIDEAWAWIEQEQAAGRLAAQAQGVASLVAVDAEHFAAARSLADTALAARSDSLEALVARACVALAEAAEGEAASLLERALQLAPEDGRTLATCGLARLQAGQLAEAQALLRRAVDGSMAAHIGSWHALGWALLLQGDRAGAADAFGRALARDENFAESHGAVGLVLALQGQAEAAQRHLTVALRLDPRNVTGRYAQALLRGEADASRLQALATRLLDRPGLLGGVLSDAVVRAANPPATGA